MTHLAPARLTALAEACAADIWEAQPDNMSGPSRISTAAPLIATTITAALAEAEPGSDRLLAALWKLGWWCSEYDGQWECQLCDARGPDKATVTHAPGCILFGQDRDLLASLDALDVKVGEPL